VTPTPTPTPPVINPFGRCSFTTTTAFTYDRALHRFVIRTVPAIVCNTPFGPQIYDLVR
jgi:phage baseplate assembly protein gpV